MKLFDAIINQSECVLNNVEDLEYSDKIIKLLEWNNWIFVFRHEKQYQNCFIVNEQVDDDMIRELDNGGFICHLEKDDVMREAFDVDGEAQKSHISKPVVVPVYGVKNGILYKKDVSEDQLHHGAVLDIEHSPAFGAQLKQLEYVERGIKNSFSNLK